MTALRAIFLVVVALLALTAPSLAGVVEDAEEALQVVPTDNPGPRNLDGSPGSSPGGSPSLGSAGSSASTESNGGSGANTRTTLTQPGGNSGSLASGSHPEVSETPAAAEQEATRRRQARDSADTAMSLVGVLILLALVVAAGIYSKRAGRDD